MDPSSESASSMDSRFDPYSSEHEAWYEQELQASIDPELRSSPTSHPFQSVMPANSQFVPSYPVFSGIAYSALAIGSPTVRFGSNGHTTFVPGIYAPTHISHAPISYYPVPNVAQEAIAQNRGPFGQPKEEEEEEEEKEEQADIGASTAPCAVKYASNGIILDYCRDQSHVQAALSNNKLKWSSLQMAIAAREDRPPGSWTPPPDPSKPRNDEDECAYALMMLEAALDMSDAEDNASFRRTWSDNMEKNRLKIEAGVWRVMEYLKEYHSKPGWVGCRPRRKNKEILPDSKYQSFAAHVEKICELFRHHKTACRNLIHEDALIVLVDDPAKYEQRTRTNQRVNQAKKTIATENRELASASRRASEVNLENAPEALTRLLALAAKPSTAPPGRVFKKRRYQEGDEEEKEEIKEPEQRSKRKRGSTNTVNSMEETTPPPGSSQETVEVKQESPMTAVATLMGETAPIVSPKPTIIPKKAKRARGRARKGGR